MQKRRGELKRRLGLGLKGGDMGGLEEGPGMQSLHLQLGLAKAAPGQSLATLQVVSPLSPSYRGPGRGQNRVARGVRADAHSQSGGGLTGDLRGAVQPDSGHCCPSLRTGPLISFPHGSHCLFLYPVSPT